MVKVSAAIQGISGVTFWDCVRQDMPRTLTVSPTRPAVERLRQGPFRGVEC